MPPNSQRKDLTSRRDEIVDAALPHVAFDGWTRCALEAGAADVGLNPADVARAFSGGAGDAVAHFSDMADRRMIEDLSDQISQGASIRDRISLAVRSRLERYGSHREAVRRAMAFLSLPGRQALALRCAYRTVDAIWHGIGDRSTDFNFYTKRGLLAGVYTATLLYWLGDDSDGFEKTWRFLDARIANVVGAIQTRRRLSKSLENLVSSLRPRRPAPGQ